MRRPAVESDDAVARGSIGFLIIAAGVVLVVIGVLVATGGLGWFGRLPGDLRIERPNVRVFVPITSMILLSVVLSLVFVIIRRLR